MRSKFLLVPLASLVVNGGPAYATVFLTVQQAQKLLFPDATFKAEFCVLTPERAKAIERASGVSVHRKEVRIWRASTGGWFIADEVVGKHEFIPFALAIDEKGAVKGLEIIEYREAYGGQIRESEWRHQFVGKKPGPALRLGKDIRNISGATLSSRHLTDGVTRLLATFEIAVRQSGG